ncbi:MBL fold metallo-hydrolase [Clostridium sp. SHJSY1]|uniref:MBL fold metallo-hydrolase n=1 Tax=Clostridium sp. SHJSY1 TaxID=2942483 RepID=UPI00287436DB|nr:MBL fold metallo-hydrolase [Clostridium sp. SHJSY1]MDS0527473.1 MBL fold metallo-hydrolase [Clostridium sp. SHJSY1]
MKEKLQTKVFISSDQYDGFGVSSTIIYGPTEALLFDAQFSRSNAHRVVAEILETGRKLKLIFISHFHPDHYLGLGVIKEAFPDARVIGYKETADEANDAFKHKVEYWGSEVLGNNGCKTVVNIERINEQYITIDNEKVEILGLMRGDCENLAALWIPSTKTLIAGDFVFSDAHLWIADARTPKERQDWLDSLDKLENLKPKLVIPGHASNNKPIDPNCIEFSRRYIKNFIRELKDSNNSVDLIERMNKIYPDLAVPICLEMSAKILKDRIHWEGDWPVSLRNKEVII